MDVLNTDNTPIDTILKSQAGLLITRIKQVGGRVFERILSEKNIDAFNGSQGRILYILWQKDGVPISELSKETGLATTTLTSMIDQIAMALSAVQLLL